MKPVPSTRYSETGVFLHNSLSNRSKLSSDEQARHHGFNRHRNRSLKKSPAVQDDEPNLTSPMPSSSTFPTIVEPRRAASFDVSTSSSMSKEPSPLPFRPGSFDAGRSAFSPVEVPRLLVHSPLSPLQVDPPPTTDTRLLTVPSPVDYRKTASESPKPAELFLNKLNFNQALLTQFMNRTLPPLSTSPIVEEFKNLRDLHFPKMESNMDNSGLLTGSPAIPWLSLWKMMQQMDCSTSGVFDNPSSSNDHFPSTNNFDHMPPKSVIQDDVRSGNGRYQLVRKRGRSEVWNLFGQVMDTSTGERLPYVACYACKVIYTDTGGGTGNMTRHRCPIGASYRTSAHGSSTETVEAAGTSSFDSIASKVEVKQTVMTNTAPVTPAVSEISKSTALVYQHSGEGTIGDVDKEILTDAVVKCCALDLIDPVVFSGKGFGSLMDKVWQMARRGGPVSPDIFPDLSTVKSSMQTHLRFCTDDLKNELSRTAQGVRLTFEKLSYCGKEFCVVHGSRISPEWKWQSNVLAVFKGGQNIADMLKVVIHNYALDRSLLMVTCSNPEEIAPIKAFYDMNEKLREVAINILEGCSIPVMGTIEAIQTITKGLIDAEARLPFEFTETGDFVQDTFLLMELWTGHWSEMEQILTHKQTQFLTLFNTLSHKDAKDIQNFLDPFKETIDSLNAEQPSFQKVLPEWYALLHECAVPEVDPSPLITELRTKATNTLNGLKDKLVTIDHKIAAILNPRLSRRIGMVLTDAERQEAYDRIRALCGIRCNKDDLPTSRGSSFDGEPMRKRRLFLSALEDDPDGDDELECYLRAPNPQNQNFRDTLAYWCNIGQQHYPSLAALVRKTLSIPPTAPRTGFDPRIASVSPEQLHTFLMLRSMFYDSEKEE